MNFVTFLKLQAFKLADTLDHDPWQEFTRPAQIKDPRPLKEKAALFEQRLQTIMDGQICIYRVPIDLGDQALWHGIATAMMAFKYSCTHDPLDLAKLKKWTTGLSLQQPNGALVRGVDGTNTLEDASNDQASGHLAGLWWAWKHGDAEVKMVASHLLDTWVSKVFNAGYALTNRDGTVTTYGRLTRGPLTDPLRASLMIAMLGAAWNVTGSYFFKAKADDLRDLYGPVLRYAKIQVGSYGNNNDAHRAAIHLRIIAETLGYSESADGLMRTWQKVRKDGNPWVAALCNTWEPSCLKVLQEMSPDDDMTNSEHVNSTNASIAKTVWGAEWCALQPLPRHKVARQDFFWQRSMRSMDRIGDADSTYFGLDFLAAYWLARVRGVLDDRA